MRKNRFTETHIIGTLKEQELVCQRGAYAGSTGLAPRRSMAEGQV